ncbi:MAG: hydrolase, partial [Chloroflexales bacterium]|nr:hydrolase [Chloroflexales bacterium]
KMLAKELQHYVPDTALSSIAFKGRYNADSKVIADDYKPPIGLSAGVIIAQENSPIFFLRDRVEELLKSAKKLARHNVRQGYYGGAIDFMVMKSITMVTDDIKAFRKAALGDGDVHKQEPLRRLTARPYAWHEFAGLLETVRALKRANMPRSQLYRIRRVMSEETAPSTIASTMEYLYTRTRLRNEVSNVLVQRIECNWQGASRLPIPPWLPMGQRSWETIWPDLIEVYEMITLPEKEETWHS